jgi:UDP-glucose 4-epimerase
MRLVITGATGNVGTAVLRRIAADRESTPDPIDVVGIARRLPDESAAPYDTATWVTCDIGESATIGTLIETMRGADAVLHLAWQITPPHDEPAMRRTNVHGSRQVATATVSAGVPHLVHQSSVGAYSPGPHARRVDESWPRDGVETSTYSRHKATAERHLDTVEQENPDLVVTRVRPSLIFQKDAGSEVGRYFLNPVLAAAASPLLKLKTPVLPVPARLRLQAVHADDVADALLRMIRQRIAGAFNLAAEPVVRAVDLAQLLGARLVDTSPAIVRRATGLSFRSRLQHTEAGWFDLAMSAPLLDTARARDVLQWMPSVDAKDAINEILAGMAQGEGAKSPPMEPRGEA